MTCALTSILPALQSVKPRAEFVVGLGWADHLQDGETLAAADTVVERAPVEDATILAVAPTAIDGTRTTTAIAVPDDAPASSYGNGATED